jgi:hypothetical protein
MGPAGLEGRYRRLLRWYPAGHRAVHREEMLGVLMAGAGPGRSRPGLTESADLLLGAARIRLRPGRALSDGPGWRDALAVYSIAAPLLVLASALISWLVAGLGPAHAGLTRLPELPEFLGLGGLPVRPELTGSGRLLVTTATWAAIGGQGLVTALALAGLRRWAAAAAAASALYLGTIAVLQLPHMPLPVGISIGLLYVPFSLLAPISETAALLAGPGPRRGRQLIRRRGWAVLAAGSALAAALTPDSGSLLYFGGESLHRGASLLTGLVAALLLLALWLTSAPGKRLALLFGMLAYGLLLTDGFIDGSGPGNAYTVNGSAGQVLVICVLTAVAYRTWRRSGTAAGGPGESPT